jgi:hypothetical protein
MRRAGIRDYESFARDMLKEIKEKLISFEIYSDEFPFDPMEVWRMKSCGVA